MILASVVAGSVIVTAVAATFEYEATELRARGLQGGTLGGLDVIQVGTAQSLSDLDRLALHKEEPKPTPLPLPPPSVSVSLSLIRISLKLSFTSDIAPA